jgi:hypothetical protein
MKTTHFKHCVTSLLSTSATTLLDSLGKRIVRGPPVSFNVLASVATLLSLQPPIPNGDGKFLGPGLSIKVCDVNNNR